MPYDLQNFFTYLFIINLFDFLTYLFIHSFYIILTLQKRDDSWSENRQSERIGRCQVMFVYNILWLKINGWQSNYLYHPFMSKLKLGFHHPSEYMFVWGDGVVAN